MAAITLSLDSCILCAAKAPEGWEHILPQALGGRLKVNLLCTKCNNEVGAPLVSKLTRDPSVVLAVENLKEEIPKLHAAFVKNVTYVAPGPDGGTIEIRDGKLRARRGPSGSLFVATERAPEHLAKQLKTMGVPEEEIKTELARFSQLPDGELQTLAPGLEVRRHTVESLSPRLDSVFVDPRWPTLAAIEFLTLNLKEAILSPGFAGARSFVMGADQPADLAVERLTTRKYAPFHGLRWKQQIDDLHCYIHLFGWLVFEVTFHRVRMEGPLAAYVEQLDKGKSLLAQDGQSDMYQILNPQ